MWLCAKFHKHTPIRSSNRGNYNKRQIWAWGFSLQNIFLSLTSSALMAALPYAPRAVTTPYHRRSGFSDRNSPSLTSRGWELIPRCVQAWPFRGPCGRTRSGLSLGRQHAIFSLSPFFSSLSLTFHYL